MQFTQNQSVRKSILFLTLFAQYEKSVKKSILFLTLFAQYEKYLYNKCSQFIITVH